jgi:hypothetical protein
VEEIEQIEQILISLIIGSSEGGFRSSDERKRAEKKGEVVGEIPVV